ncbi:MAG: tetratricopeptide repeat protein [Acidobacteriota bacterium]|nr:tetratricopeptide repeat protein [Acidobacteriota bacterium]
MGVASLTLFLFVSPGLNCHAQPSFEMLYVKATNGTLSSAERDAAFTTASRLCPGDVGLYTGYSSFLLAQGQFGSALKIASSGLQWSSANSKLRLNKAIALYSLRRARESLEILNDLPPSAEVSFYQGLNQIRLAEHAEARKSLRRAWESGYRDPHLLYLLIEEDHATQDKAAGLADFQTMLQQYPDSAWLHMALGNAAFALEKDQQARSEYERALALNTQLPNANFRLGYLAYQAGQDEIASRYFLNELAVDPEHADAALFEGETLKRLGRTREAIPYLKNALALDPASAQAYGTFATALIETGQSHDAVNVLLRAEARFPTDPAFPAQLARLFARLDRKDDADKASERVRALLAIKRKKEESTVKQ